MVSVLPPIDVHDQAAFDALQSKLVALWRSIDHMSEEPQTIVAVPSIDVDMVLTPDQVQGYEERYLFLLLLLRQPNAHMVYVTGQEIDPEIIDYYLDLLPGVERADGRRRLHLVSPRQATSVPLTAKLLTHPETIEEIRSFIPDPDRAHMIPFMPTWSDRELAMRLAIPMYGTDPRFAVLGTKSSGRRLFDEVGVSHPVGVNDVRTREDVVDAVVEIRRVRSNVSGVVIKTDVGVSGFGNTIVDLIGLPEAGTPEERNAVGQRLERLAVASPAMTTEDYFRALSAEGGIVEEMVEGAEIRSPSAQMRVTPLGEVELLSTHDQVLGGESGQIFMGSRFPADPDYASLIGDEAMKVGRRLGELGVIGRFAVDFVVARNGGEACRAYAIEINLRKGGTTHPYLTLQFLTDGSYDGSTGLFRTPEGNPKFYVASDHLDAPGMAGRTPGEVVALARSHRLAFDAERQAGSVFHMMRALGETGQVGVTCVGDSPSDAQRRYEETAAFLAMS